MQDLSYKIPCFKEKDLKEPNVRAWVNFFGQEWLYSIKERIQKVLEINQSVFQEDCAFSDYIFELLYKDPSIKKMNTIQKTPRKYYEKHLTPYDLQTMKSTHHIIFQNNCVGGNIGHKENRIDMERGIHNSFHTLLNQQDIYPHAQISKFLQIESDYLDESFIQSIQKIEQEYTKLFKKKPFEIYKPECFSQEFQKQYKKNIIV